MAEEHTAEIDARTTGHAWVNGRCVNCDAEKGRPWAEVCPNAEIAAPYPVPTPWLTYYFWDRDTRPPPNGVTPEPGSPRLYSIIEVSVSVSPWGDGMRVTLQGPMLKRDGTPGRHRRCCTVDLDARQPGWLDALIADARVRLTRPTPPVVPHAAPKDNTR